jgi:hypothetical protein
MERRFGYCQDKLPLPVKAQVSAIDSYSKVFASGEFYVGLSRMQLENLGIERSRKLPNFLYVGIYCERRDTPNGFSIPVFVIKEQMDDRLLRAIGLEELASNGTLEGGYGAKVEISFKDRKEVAGVYNALYKKDLEEDRIRMSKALADSFGLSLGDTVEITDVLDDERKPD